MKSSQCSLKAIDFFCGAGGMTNGFKNAGVRVLAGVDIDKECQKTYLENNKSSKYICEDIKEMSVQALADYVNISQNDDKLIFIGCSPCQYWSVISTNKTKSEETKNLLIEFQRFVDYFNPGYVVIENVPGITTKKDSPLQSFLDFLDAKGYRYDKDIIKVSHYGVPQTRKRFILMASRIKGKEKIKLPEPDTKNKPPTVGQYIIDDPDFYAVNHGHRDITSFNHTVAGLDEKNIERLEMTPEGCGND